jgi:hypothetical protein
LRRLKVIKLHFQPEASLKKADQTIDGNLEVLPKH